MFLFNNELTALKSVINKHNLIECNLTQEINKAGQLSILADLSLYKKTSDGDMIVVHDHDDEYLLFRIVKREALNDKCSILALEYGYYCLSVCDYIKDYRPHDQPMNVVLNKVLENTGWILGKLDSFSNYTGTFYYQTPLECLSAIGSAKGCEFKFTVSMSNNQITSKRLNVYKHIGQHLHKQFTLGMNALEVVAESDSTSIYKRALGRGKGEESGDGYGRRIEFTDVVWSKAKGNPVDKPKGKNWVEEDLTGNNYILPGNKKPLKIVTFDEVEDPAQLLQLTYDWLINNNRPKLQLKTSIADAGELNLGDYVFVTRPDINLRYETRVFKINRNLLNHNLSTVEFGDNIAIKPMDKINDVSNRVEIVGNKVDQVQENISIIDATGVKVNYGNSEPKDKKKGDIWFYTTEDGEEILLRWDGEKWVRVVDNKIIEEIETTVDNALKESEKAKQDSLDAINKADQAVNAADELTDKVVKIDTDINGKDFNLIQSFDVTPQMTNTGNHFDRNSTSIDNWSNFGGSSFAGKTLEAKFIQSQPSLQANKEYTASFWINTNCDLFGNDCYLKLKISNNQLITITQEDILEQKEVTDIFKPSSKCKEYKVKCTFNSSTNFEYPQILAKTSRKLQDNYNAYSHIAFKYFQVVEGREVKPWGANEGLKQNVIKIEQGLSGTQETISNLDGRVTQNTQTIDGFNRKIQGIEGQITEINETSEGLRVDVNNNKGNIGKLTASSEVFQSKLQNLEESTTTKITQLDKLIQLQASQIGPFYPNGNFDDENLTNWYELTWNDIGASVQIQDKTLVLQSTSTAKASAITKDYIEVDGTQPFIIKFQALWTKNGNKANARIYVHEYDEHKNEIRNANDLIFSAENYPDNFWNIEKKWITDKNPKYIRIEWVVWNNPSTSLQLKNITLSNGVGNLSSSVNVALDSASLAVKKDDVINSVNVSTEGVLIDGKKVHITGQTTIDNAVIKDAMIANLSASKLTAGTIDASKINVININAANIVGNKTQFVESAWNSINSNLRIDSNGLTIKKSNGENLLLSNGSFQFRDRNNREIFGISRFADGTVNLAVNKGEVMSITYQGSIEDLTYSPALSFGGTNGAIRFDSSNIAFQDREIRFTTMDWGNGRVPSFRDPGNKTGVGLGSSILYFGDSKGILTLDNIRQGKLDALTFPDGRRLNLVSGTIGSTKVGFIMGVNDVGIAWSGGDLYFHNNYRSGWIKFEDILKKIKW